MIVVFIRNWHAIGLKNRKKKLIILTAAGYKAPFYFIVFCFQSIVKF